MAQYSRIQVIRQMEQSGMVPLFYHSDIKVVKSVVKACYDGGARLIEFTNRGDLAIDIFSELMSYVISELPTLIVGVGSITDAESASRYMMAGASFVVTPVFRNDIAVVCNRRKVLWSPGCGSLTEITKAEEMGCELVKLFPGGTYGPSFVKAIKGPQPWTLIMPTGGVTTEENNLRGWFDSGVLCVGIGSKLISKEILLNKDYVTLQKDVSRTLNVIKSIRK